MDAAQWPKALVYDFHKEIGHVNNPNGGSCDIPGSNSPSSHSKQDKKKQTKPNKDQTLNCPRCNSTNTKFCYYNNYNPTQPRYLCKACRRYWTHGGTLRNVPVGGSSRKKNRPSSLAPNSLSNNSKLFLDLNPKPTTMLANFSSSVPLNPTRSFMHEINNHDLNMGLYYANAHHHHHHFLPIPQNFELSASQGGLSSYHVPMSETNTRLLYPSSGFHFQDIIKPTLNLSMDGGLGGGAGSRATPPYPFGELKQDSTTSSTENVMDQTNGDTRDHSNNGVVYWNNNGLYN